MHIWERRPAGAGLTRRPRLALLPALLVALLCAVLGAATPSRAQDAPVAEPSVEIVLFWGDGCPHCAAAGAFLTDLVAREPRAVLTPYEVWYDAANAELLVEMAHARGFEPTGVPTIIVGERYWVGYADAVGAEIEAYVATCLAGGCADGGEPEQVEAIRLPFVGAIDLQGESIWLSTALIAFVDGFNPCSLWVLSILIALALHAGSRGRVLVIGLTFITVTAGVYALFIAGVFTLLTVASVLGWVQVLVSLVALFFAAINIKDYFFFQQGLSFTIDERQKPGIYRRMRDAVATDRSPVRLVAATVILAGAVSLIEFSCTAGFPVLWTNLLTAQDVPPAEFAALLLLYLLIYQADELVIFLVAVFTLKASRIDERQGRFLKLLGGVLMLALAGVMLVSPALLNRVDSSLVVFGVAFVATAVIVVVHRLVLPRLGIRIGDRQDRSGR